MSRPPGIAGLMPMHPLRRADQFDAKWHPIAPKIKGKDQYLANTVWGEMNSRYQKGRPAFPYLRH